MMSADAPRHDRMGCHRSTERPLIDIPAITQEFMDPKKLLINFFSSSASQLSLHSIARGCRGRGRCANLIRVRPLTTAGRENVLKSQQRKRRSGRRINVKTLLGFPSSPQIPSSPSGWLVVAWLAERGETSRVQFNGQLLFRIRPSWSSNQRNF